MPTCKCGSSKSVSLEPKLRQLIFGGFLSTSMEYRCRKCEKQVADTIKRILKARK